MVYFGILYLGLICFGKKIVRLDMYLENSSDLNETVVMQFTVTQFLQIHIFT